MKMEVIKPPNKFPNLQFLSFLVLLFQHIHLTVSAHSLPYTVAIKPYDSAILQTIQKHFGPKAHFMDTSSPVCCVLCSEAVIYCSPGGDVVGLSLNSDKDHLSGNIPTAITQLPSLSGLWLTGPGFTGPIPSFIGKMTKLSELGIYNTRLTGRIPGSVGRLSIIKHINIVNNTLINGFLPKSLSRLTKVSTLDLSSNKLSGPIPDIFGTMSSIYVVNLRSNRFSGSIPKSLGQANLYSLDVSYNQLCGPIPNTLTMKRQHPTNFGYNKCLCGAPLPWPCNSKGLPNIH